MKVDTHTAKRLRVPTTGMEKFHAIRHQVAVVRTGLYDELKSARFYRGDRKLQHHNQSTNTAYKYMYFVQREDGQFFTGSTGDKGTVAFEAIKRYLDPNVKADVIVCQVPADKVDRKRYLDPEYGALEFIACHSPSHNGRVVATALLMKMADDAVAKAAAQ
jgi:hypothetical protein